MSPPSPPTAQLRGLAIGRAGDADNPEMVTTRGQARAAGESQKFQSLSGQRYLWTSANIPGQPSYRSFAATCFEIEDIGLVASRSTQDSFQFRLIDASKEDGDEERYSTVNVARSGEEAGAPECGCSDDTAEAACKHIFWLLNKVADVPGAMSNKEFPIKLRQDGLSEPSLAVMITASCIRQLDAITWHARESDRAWYSTQLNPSLKAKFQELFELFEPNRLLPQEYGAGFTNTLSRQLRRDEWAVTSCYHRLQQVIVNRTDGDISRMSDRDLEGFILCNTDHDFQTFDNFKACSKFLKYGYLAESFFHQLDRYSIHSSSPSIDVTQCANLLQEHVVKGISITLHELHGDHTSISYAVYPLVHILAEIVLRRNRDAYQDILWHRAGGAADDDDGAADNNLYVEVMLSNKPENSPGLLEVICGLPREAVQMAVRKEPIIAELRLIIYAALDGDHALSQRQGLKQKIRAQMQDIGDLMS